MKDFDLGDFDGFEQRGAVSVCGFVLGRVVRGNAVWCVLGYGLVGSESPWSVGGRGATGYEAGCLCLLFIYRF